MQDIQWHRIQKRAFHSNDNGLFCTHPLTVVPLFWWRERGKQEALIRMKNFLCFFWVIVSICHFLLYFHTWNADILERHAGIQHTQRGVLWQRYLVKAPSTLLSTVSLIPTPKRLLLSILVWFFS